MMSVKVGRVLNKCTCHVMSCLFLILQEKVQCFIHVAMMSTVKTNNQIIEEDHTFLFTSYCNFKFQIICKEYYLTNYLIKIEPIKRQIHNYF